jgi:RND family efflux transporter MFP subunit
VKRLALLCLFAAACGNSNSVPTFTVEPVHFTRRVTAEGNLKAKMATPVSAPQEVRMPLKVSWIAADGTLVKKDELIARFDRTEFEELLRSGNDDRTTADNKRGKLAGESSTTKKNLERDAEQADTELAAAKKFDYGDERIYSQYARIESQLDQQLAVDRKTHARGVLGVREKLSKADAELVDIEAKKADLKLRDANQGLGSLELRSPYDGILVLQRDWRGEVLRVGSTTWPGQPLGEIPDLRTMKAEVFVLEADAAGIAVGQRATVALESDPLVMYAAKVAQIDKLARPRTRGVPVQYFGVTLELDRTDPKVMKPGARVRGVLEVENRANAFSIPRQAVFEKNGKKVVYRRQRGKFLPIEVAIATSTAGRVVVTKGVAKGDILALVDPTEEKDHDERG